MSKYKFKEDGTAIPYYGNTIISFLNTKDFIEYEVLLEMQRKLKETKYADYFAYLPPSSYHMTLIPLCRVIDKGTNSWPNRISEDIKFRDVDKLVKEKVDQIEKPNNVIMKVRTLGLNGLRLVPANEDVEKTLRDYRDKIAQITGIIHPGHKDYEFHATTSYTVKELGMEGEKFVENLFQELYEKYKYKFKEFKLPEPQFVIFNDMLSYESDLSQRGNLY